MEAPDIRVKRIYERAHAADGTRVLVERIWPCGVSAESAALDLWLPNLGPTPALRAWFGRDPGRFPAFRAAYEQALAAREQAIGRLLALDCPSRLTLLYIPRDRVHNHATILADYLRRRLLDRRVYRADSPPETRAGRRAPAMAQEGTYVGGA